MVELLVIDKFKNTGIILLSASDNIIISNKKRHKTKKELDKELSEFLKKNDKED